MFLISSVFVAGAAIFLVRVRQATVMDILPHLMKDAREVQIYVHQILHPIRLQRQSRLKRGLQMEQDISLLDSAQNLFIQATASLPQSAMLQVFVAMFFFFYRRNMYATLLHLHHAEKLSPGLDLSYIIYIMRSSVSETISSDSESKATTEFAEFTASLAKALDADSSATKLEIEFWSSLDQSSNSDFDRMSSDINKVTATR